MEKITIGGRLYSIIGCKDMKNVIHVGQNLRILLYLEDKSKVTYNLFVTKNYAWTLANLEGKIRVSGDDFVTLIKDSNIGDEFKVLILRE